MRSLVLSCLDSVLQLVFALLAVQVGRKLPVSAGSQRHAWQMTGVAFLVFAAVLIPQMAFGTTVYVLGAEHPAFAAYLRLMPVANHSRTLLVWGLYLCLGVLAFRGDAAWPRLRRAYPVVLAAMLLAGGALGWMEGTFNAARHLSNTSLMDAIGFVGVGSLLFVLMLRDTIDRALWVALVLNGTSSVMSSLFLAAIAWVNVDTWIPRTWVLEVSRVLFVSAMIWMAVWRLRLANRGVPLAGLLGTNRPRPLLA